MVQDEPATGLVGVLVEVVDAVGVEQRGAPLDAVHLIALVQQEFRQVGAVLASHSGDQGGIHIGWAAVLSDVPMLPPNPHQSETSGRKADFLL